MSSNTKVKKDKQTGILKKGIFSQNPIFVQMLGMCTALAVTANVESALGMGVLVIFVVTCSNAVISLIKDFVPSEVKIPSFIVVIATFVTIVSLLTQAYAPALYTSLGVFVSLIVVNCIVLGRAEAYASKNTVLNSMLDGLGMGLGYTIALVVIAFVRELLAKGSITMGNVLPFNNVYTIFDLSWFGLDTSKYAISFFGSPAGAFITIGVIMSLISVHNIHKAEKIEAQKKARIEELKRIKKEKDLQKKMEESK